MSPMKLFTQLSIAAVGIAIIGLAGLYIYTPKKSAQVPGTAINVDAAKHIATAQFYDLDEKLQPLAQWQGKVLVINFWATWCPPCREEIPEFIKFQKQYGKQGVQFVGIAIDQRSKVKSYAEEMKMNYPILLGDLAGIDLAKRIGNDMGGLPYSVIVDRAGKVVFSKLGTLNYEQLETTIKPLL